MCGIAAIYAYHYAANTVDVGELERICRAMAVRGPDGEGTWTFSWPVKYAAFAPNSWLCGTVSWDGQSSDPNCVKIEPGN